MPCCVYILLFTTCFRNYLAQKRKAIWINEKEKYVLLKAFMGLSQNPYVLIELCLTEMGVETGNLLTPVCQPIIPPFCFSLLLCFILISHDQFLCLHICFQRARHSCLQLLALACKSTWPTSRYSPHQNNADSSVPISNSWEKESAAARVTCALLAGEERLAMPGHFFQDAVKVS